ncbi:MAG: cytochrome c oxidase assembly factor Coa1 family protein [Bacteroidota bacterium]
MEENPERKGWFGRNWKWAVPVGCLVIVIMFIVLVAGGIFWGVTSLMGDSEPYKTALYEAQNNESVIEYLGEPIETNGMAGGSIQYSNGLGSAELTIPIKGPKGEATIRVTGDGVDENWQYEQMDVYLKEDNTIINLLEDRLLDQ